MNELKTILYAEDEEDIREITKIALEDIGGLNVHYCANGNEVLNLTADIPPPDLLLLDVMMPGMDGVTLLRKLKRLPQYKEIPTIFMTAKVQPQELEEYKTLGVIDVIVKPFDPVVLADTVKKIWNKAHGQ